MPNQAAVQTNSPSVTHATFTIERSYPVTPDRVFGAFADPLKKRRWFAEGDSHSTESFDSDFRVGGAEYWKGRLNERTPFPGATVANQTIYQDIVPNRRIVLAYTMTLNDCRISTSLATFDLLATANHGTTLLFTDQGAYFEGADGPQLREEGWRKHFENFAVEMARS